MERSEGIDIPLIRLRPLRDRKVTKREFDRILASIKVVGLSLARRAIRSTLDLEQRQRDINSRGAM